MTTDQLSIVIPALNEAALIGRTLECVRGVTPHAVVIVVDGGSTDGTQALATRNGATLVETPRGRGIQCHAGALRADSEWLLFLHADTLLPIEAERVVAEFIGNPRHQLATFQVRFDGNAFLNAWARLVRFDSVFTRFADQGVLIRRRFYDQLGGFPPWPLFEDVALFQRARKLARIHWLPATVTTSARRFRNRGILRQRFLNAALMLRYLGGASPFDLAARYRGEITPDKSSGSLESAAPARADSAVADAKARG